ncbi:MAG TPA: hypothetical protein VFF17_02640, partial [Thermoanaerobaculia bacterium]|nr:hypothetical protein [Thermoanaerobaculia bacterium]
TWMVQDIAPGPVSSRPAGFTRTASKVFFSADDDVSGTELWAIPAHALGVRGGQSPRPTRTLPFRP